MAFYHGRGTAFWQPSSEGANERVVDALTLFPSEPAEPGSAAARDPHEPEPTPDGDLYELQGLAVHLNQTCGRIEELATRTENMLRRVERLTATVNKELEAAERVRHPLRAEPAGSWTTFVTSVRARSIRARTELQTQALIARRAVQRHVRLPLRNVVATWRKRAVIARVTTVMELEQLVSRLRHAAVGQMPGPAVTVVIRHPSLNAPAPPAIAGASAGVMFAALVSGLVLVTAGPASNPLVPGLPDVPQAAGPQVTRAGAFGTIPDVLSSLFSTKPAEPPTSLVASPVQKTLPVAAATAASSREFFGKLTIESEPAGASVFVNQDFVGQTPVTLSELRAGSRAVWIESEGYQRWSAGVLVPADKETRINVKLQLDRQR